MLWSLHSHSRHSSAGELLDASTHSLRSPGLCLPLRGELQLTVIQPLAYKPELFILITEGPLVVVKPPQRCSIIFGFCKNYVSGSRSESSESHIEWTAYTVLCSSNTFMLRMCVQEALCPVDLSSCLRVSLGLHDGESFLLLAHFLQPLFFQKRHQRVPHVHHLNHLLKDPLFFRLLLRCLVCQTNKHI